MKVLAVTLGIAAILSTIDAQLVGCGIPPPAGLPNMVNPILGFPTAAYPPVGCPICPTVCPPTVHPQIGLNAAENSNANSNTNVNNNGGGASGRWL